MIQYYIYNKTYIDNPNVQSVLLTQYDYKHDYSYIKYINFSAQKLGVGDDTYIIIMSCW